MKKWGLLLVLWGCWGFALGTVLLLGPVRKTVDYARSQNWSETQEKLVVLCFILALAVVSFLLARWSSKTLMSADKPRSAKLTHGAVPILAAFAALFVLMNPSLVNADTSTQTNLSTQFTIGPYPDEEKIDQLEDGGFTAIVSLLHPAVVPFEPKLLSEEREIAKKNGLEMISIPMLPWVSDNTASIDSFRKFIRTAKGKYYIHCYLGKDRVNVARRMIEQENATALNFEKSLGHRSIDSIKQFERGTIYKLAEQVYLSPMPTKEEYIGYVIATDFKQVVSLSDPAEPEARTSNANEAKLLASYQVDYKVFNVPANASEQRIQQIIDSVKHLPKPVLVHSFKTDQPIAQIFLKLYK